ncbi:DUF4430 domain-containing protein [Enterococcus sp. LJL99]
MKKVNYFLILVGLVTLAACSSTNTTESSSAESSTSTSSTMVTEMTVDISLVKEGKEVTNKEVTVEEGTTLMDAMKKNFDLVEENQMITAIDGIEQNKKENYYWTYKINDEMVNTGAAETTLHSKDKVVFTYEKF